jgi:hypothetical protein
LARLGRERLHHADAGDVLLDLRGQLGDALLHLLERRARAPAVAHRGQHDEGYRRQRGRREPRLQGEHGRRGEHDGEPALRDEDQPVAEEEAHGLQVDGRAGHQLSGLLRVEERELELLEVAVDDVAQVDLDPQRDAARDEAAGGRQAEAGEGHHDDRARQELEVVLVARLDSVDRTTRQPRDRHGGDHRQGGQDERPNSTCAVRAEKPEQAEEGAHATTG